MNKYRVIRGPYVNEFLLQKLFAMVSDDETTELVWANVSKHDSLSEAKEAGGRLIAKEKRQAAWKKGELLWESSE